MIAFHVGLFLIDHRGFWLSSILEKIKTIHCYELDRSAL